MKKAMMFGPWGSLLRGENIRSKIVVYGATQAGGMLLKNMPVPSSGKFERKPSARLVPLCA